MKRIEFSDKVLTYLNDGKYSTNLLLDGNDDVIGVFTTNESLLDWLNTILEEDDIGEDGIHTVRQITPNTIMYWYRDLVIELKDYDAGPMLYLSGVKEAIPTLSL